MNETVLWLLYLVGAAAAFAAVNRFGWKIVPSTLAGAGIATLGWAIVYFLTDADKRPTFWKVDLSMHISFAVIFAAVGAAIAFALMSRRSEG